MQLRSRNVERAARAKRSLGRARCAAGEKQEGGILRTDACLDGLAGVVAQQIAQPLVSRLQRDPKTIPSWSNPALLLAEISLSNAFVREQLASRTGKDDVARFKDVALVRQAKRGARVLLYKQDRDSRGVDLFHRVENCTH